MPIPTAIVFHLLDFDGEGPNVMLSPLAKQESIASLGAVEVVVKAMQSHCDVVEPRALLRSQYPPNGLSTDRRDRRRLGGLTIIFGTIKFAIKYA